jgi:tight adherence protein B
MSVVLGLMLGVGVLLAASPLLWPARGATTAPRAPGRMRERLVQAGLERVPIGAFLLVSVVVGAGLAAAALALVPVVAVGAVAAVAGLALPTLLVLARARRRRRAARVVWPDVVDHLVSAVRSGLALPDAVVTLARTGPPDARAAFGAFERDYRVTGDFALCLDRLKERLADPVADRIVETLRMAREVGGGELTLVLRNLATYLRQDAAVRSEVEARQSWVVVAARLGLAAPWIVLLLLATRPEAAAAYDSPTGALVVVVGAAVTVAAYRIMLAVGRLPEERRWFR